MRGLSATGSLGVAIISGCVLIMLRACCFRTWPEWPSRMGLLHDQVTVVMQPDRLLLRS
jgi:hypothetical protein